MSIISPPHHNIIHFPIPITNFDILITSLSPKSSDSSISSYLNKLFAFLSNGKDTIKPLTFLNWSNLPYFLSSKLYNTIRSSIDFKKITKDSFIHGLKSIYGGCISFSITFSFSVLDFNKDHSITKEDVRIFLEQFHSIYNEGSLSMLYEIINDFFAGEKTMTLGEYEEKVRQSNSDVFLLVYAFLVEHQLVNEESVAQNDKEHGKSDKGDEVDMNYFKEQMKQLAAPSEQLYQYLYDQFHYEFKNGIRNDIDDLDDFETELIECKQEYLNGSGEKVVIKSPMNMKESYQTMKRNDNNILATMTTNSYTDLHTITAASTVSPILSPITRINRLSIIASPMTVSKQLSPLVINPTPLTNDTKTQKSLYKKYSFTIYTNSFIKEIYVKGRIDVVGNDLYLYQSNETYYIIPIREIELQKNKRDTVTPYYPMQLTSHISTKPQTFQFFFETKSARRELIALIKAKANFKSFSQCYQIIELIGKGAFGTVVKALNKITKNEVAIKILEKDNVSIEEMLYIRQEQSICQFLMKNPHENIIKIKEVFESFTHVYIVLEYIPNGTLGQYMNEHKGRRLDNAMIIDIVSQLGKAIEYLSYHGIVHRDIKMDNTMLLQSSVSENGNGNEKRYIIKVIDFGFSVIVGQDEQLTECVGTFNYLSPEIKKKESYSRSVDVWAFGIVCFYLIFGGFPGSRLGKVKDNDFKMIINDQSKIKMELSKVVNFCLDKRPDQRISIEQVVKMLNIINSKTCNIS